jgi:shikimate dehydrogenase
VAEAGAPGAGWPDAATTVVGVTGYPVRHSLSPLLHNAAFAALELNWVSLGFEVVPGPGQIAAALAGMRALQVRGLSVTMPHKADVASLVDECSPAAARLGAVNCIINHEGVLRGDNTDGAGFLASLVRAAGFDPAGKRCVVMGAGGAARAVIVALAEAGAASVSVVNRTASRAVDAAALAGTLGEAVEVGHAADTVARDADLVVNATPVGMEGAGSAEAGSLIDPSLLHEGQVVVDLVYVPRPTPWLAAAGAAGATAVDGLGMLVHQAAVQVELWTGLPAPVDAMWRAAAVAL